MDTTMTAPAIGLALDTETRQAIEQLCKVCADRNAHGHQTDRELARRIDQLTADLIEYPRGHNGNQ